jgi:hypothetical protein
MHEQHPSSASSFFKTNATQIIVGALVLVSALAWNDFFKHWLQSDGKRTTRDMLVYATAVTGLALGVAWGATKFMGVKGTTVTTMESDAA